MFYNRAIKVSSSHNQSYTEIGSVYHGAYLSHILIVPPLRAYSGRGSVLFSFLVYFFYKTLFSILPFSADAACNVPTGLLIISSFLFCRDAPWCVRYCLPFVCCRDVACCVRNIFNKNNPFPNSTHCLRCIAKCCCYHPLHVWHGRDNAIARRRGYRIRGHISLRRISANR